MGKPCNSCTKLLIKAVFVPTDAAFAQLTARGHAALLEPANARKLGAVLMYHIVPGRFPAAQLQHGQVLRTSHSPMTLKVTKQGRSTWVYDRTTNGPAALQTTDIQCDNGIIHVIDNVLLPVAQRPAPAR